ncbi:MAG: hypothetical protein LQ338_003397 [Usnochroma carphineum]|nr:MAG: hypothetical protein LQ338_003397 [Usnochroma carphineum]
MYPSLPSVLLLASILSTSVSALAIDKRHHAWPEAIRSYYVAAAEQLSHIRSTTPTSTLTSLTPSSCNLASPTMPSISGLPPVSPGLSLYHVAIGRGTQNYTCDIAHPSSAPVAVGANAGLYNTTCVSCVSPTTLQKIPAAALLLPAPKENQVLFPAQAVESGHHYFTDLTTPTFNLHTQITNYGIQFAKVLTKVPVPDSMQQLGPDQSKAVPWLKLSSANAPDGLATDDSPVKEIYRINTAGGSAPTTCDSMPASFEVQYAAEYWFWG